MSSIQNRLLRSKQRWEKKLKSKQERRDKLGKEIFDFPNLTIPLSMFTFMPAFLILVFTVRYFTHNKNMVSICILLAIFGIIMGGYICKLENRWFSYYGTKTILKEPIKPRIQYIILYIVYSVALIGTGSFIQSDYMLYIFFTIFAISCIAMGLYKEGIMWEMPPAYLLGFRKYNFVPQHSDNHCMRNANYTCVIRKVKKLDDNSRIEGTFLGNSWFYLRKEKYKEETETNK